MLHPKDPCRRRRILHFSFHVLIILSRSRSFLCGQVLFEMAGLTTIVLQHNIIFLLLPFAATPSCLQLLLVVEAATPVVVNDLERSFSNSTLELNVGLNLSVANAFNKSSLLPNSPNSSMFSVAITAANTSWFLPIISSPSFKSANASERRGFSFGFYFQDRPDPGHSADSVNMYLGVCGGVSGNYLSNLSDPLLGGQDRAILRGSANSHSFYAPTVLDGGAVLVWRVNATTSLMSYDAYLQVNEAQTLELRDYNGQLVWNVSNVGLMEIQDSGTLLIYHSFNTSQVVWRSGPRDTLFLGEKLQVGQQLTSATDSSYSLRMEEGGLVLYLNTMQFMHQRPAPYWAIPTFNYHPNTNSTTGFFSSPPCTKGAAFAKLEGSLFFAFQHSFGFILDPGTCSNNTLGINTQHSASPTDIDRAGPLSFVKLEDDGWLHSYAVSVTSMKLEDGIASPIPNWDSFFYFDTRQPISSSSYSTILQVSLMDITCAVPNHCGPLGLCTPFANCTCPPSFTTRDNSNANKGCDRITRLPNCTKDEHIHTTEYISLNHTATSFLLSGWAFNASISTDKVELCKMSCSANCSCSGFFYQGHTFSCFFITITDEMSLLNMTLNLTTYGKLDIQPSNYVTYLKVIKSDQINSPPSGRTTVITIAVVLSSLAVCLGLGLAVYVVRSRARMRERAVQAAELEEELGDVIALLPSRFSFQDLKRATGGFSKLLGVGACGSVYFGMLEDGRKVAVKTLESTMKGEQSKQFLAEVATIGQTCHHNVVRLIGFCWEVSSRSLVYEYMEKRSLDHWLFVKPAGAGGPAASVTAHDAAAPNYILDWQTRYRVVLGIARGLRYLHEECPQPILHFDIKPQNILLDDYFVPKLADFGMSRLMQRDISKVVTGIRGTPGYIAPEWVLHGEVSKKSDVYSMGMVMLEIVGGRRNLDLELVLLNSCHDNDNSSGRCHEAWHFPSWAAARCEQGLEMELVDNRLQGAFEMEQARRLIYTAFWCIQEDPGMRPYVPTVVQWLEGMSPLKQPPFSSAANSRYKPSSTTSSSLY